MAELENIDTGANPPHDLETRAATVWGFLAECMERSERAFVAYRVEEACARMEAHLVERLGFTPDEARGKSVPRAQDDGSVHVDYVAGPVTLTGVLLRKGVGLDDLFYFHHESGYEGEGEFDSLFEIADQFVNLAAETGSLDALPNIASHNRDADTAGAQ